MNQMIWKHAKELIWNIIKTLILNIIVIYLEIIMDVAKQKINLSHIKLMKIIIIKI